MTAAPRPARASAQLDSATNDTSLVIAIERISDNTVLLFPADAQQGNSAAHWPASNFALC